MAVFLNKVFLIGNLTRDPELRYAPSGDAVVRFRIAVGRTFTTASGEQREDTCFVNVVAWRKLAEICGEHLSRGSKVLVEGRLQSRSWETQDGQRRSVIEVVADRVQFLTRPGQAGEPVEEIEEAPDEEVEEE